MRMLLASTFALVATAVVANDDLAEQIDSVAPLLAAGQFEDFGGPDTHEAIVNGVDGRWFTLQNTARNWKGDAAANRERLAQTIERTCSDTWENIVTHEVTGPGTFIVSQQSPSGEDQGTFEVRPLDDEPHAFTTFVSDEDILEMLNLATATAEAQAQALAEVRDVLNQGVQIWRPTADLMVNSGAGDVEIWGRCPS